MELRIKDIAQKVGIENAKQLAKATGLSVTSCYQLWNGTAKAISFESLNTLCNVLRAGPAILLDYTPDAETQAKQSGAQGGESVNTRRSRRGSTHKSRREVKARTDKAALAVV